MATGACENNVRYRAALLLQPFVRAPLILNVRIDADPLHEGSGSVANRAHSRQEPAEGAVPSAQWKFEFDRLAGCDGSLPVCNHGREMFRVVNRLPARPFHLFGSRPRVLVPPSVVVVDASVGLRGPPS